MRLSRFLLVLSSTCIVPVLALATHRPSVDKPGVSIRPRAVEVDRLNGELYELHLEVEQCKNLVNPSGGERSQSARAAVNCRDAASRLIDGLRAWFKYAEMNIEINYEELAVDITVTAYKERDRELRKVLQDFGIAAQMALSKKPFKSEERDFLRRKKSAYNRIKKLGKWPQGNIQELEEALKYLPDDWVLLKISRELEFLTTLNALQRFFTKVQGKIHQAVTPRYLAGWRLGVYDGLIAAFGMRRQLVPLRSERPQLTADMYIGELFKAFERQVAIQRSDLIRADVTERLEDAYRRRAPEDDAEAQSRRLRTLKDLNDWFEDVERSTPRWVVKTPKPHLLDVYSRYHAWYITLAEEYVAFAMGGRTQQADFVSTPWPEIDRLFNEALAAWEDANHRRSKNPPLTSDFSARVIRRMKLYYAFKRLLVDNPDAFPFSLGAWEFNTLRGIIRWDRIPWTSKPTKTFVVALLEQSFYHEKPEVFEKYAWDYGHEYTFPVEQRVRDNGMY